MDTTQELKIPAMAYSVRGESSSRSSASNTTPKWNYAVFLSFFGKDTRLNFTDHLFDAFRRSGIRAFRDDEGIERGEVIPQQLFQAIEDSLTAVVILSENYAFSTWCLDELQMILECRKKLGGRVFPIFYGVDPSDVRYQKKNFGEALAKHEVRFREGKDKVQKWRDALYEVSNLSGWNTKNQHETDVIRIIVKEIWTNLCSKLPPYNNNLVGINSKMADLISCLEIGLENVRFVGIWGMGGIGKTTLARVVYEKISEKFEMCCFLANVKEITEREGQVHLQKKLLSHLNISDMKFEDEYEGKKIIRYFFCNRKVLIVLDDINDASQLENLAELPDWFGAGSRVIITTRDSHLLISHEVHEIYQMEHMGKDESLQLFSRKAFNKDKPEEEYLMLSKFVVEYAGGLPLALNVLGSFLRKRSVPEWEDTLNKLKRIPNDNIMKKLKISYDTLDYEEKEMFLDIACFFKGWQKDDVTRILKNCGFHVTIGMRVLIERALLTWKNHFCGTVLWMHDLLQELGRNIIFQESPNNVGKRSRLWNSKDIKEVLKTNNGSEAIQAIVLCTHDKVEVHPESFSKMINLRLFYSTCKLKHCSGFKYSSQALKVIAWRDGPLEALPLDIHLMKKLKHIDLRFALYLRKTPNFSGVPNLETLNLTGCKYLVEVHSSVGKLKKLVNLNLSGCKSLEILPSKLEMDSLMKLDLFECYKISVLPEFGECMKKLSFLNVRETAITELPKSLGFLTGLRDLDLHGCKNLPFHNLLKNLTTPEICGFSPAFLTQLCLRHCGISDGSIPDDFGCLSSLLALDLALNDFVDLPTDCFSNLCRLQYLDLSSCPSLKSLPKLPPKLIRLDAEYCPSMEPLSERQLWNMVSSLDHEYRHRTRVETTQLNHIESEYLPQREFFAIISGNELPTWFKNKDYFQDMRKKEKGDHYSEREESVVIKVDIPQHFCSSEWSGIVVCLNIGCGDVEKGCIWWSSKAPEDDHYIFKQWAHHIWHILIPDLCIMVLHLNDKTCWQHLRGGNNCLHIKLCFHSTYHSGLCPKIHIRGCGWRLLCKEEIEEWCNNTNDFNKPTKEHEVSTSSEVQCFPSLLRGKMEHLYNQPKATDRNEKNKYLEDDKIVESLSIMDRPSIEFFVEDGSISRIDYLEEGAECKDPSHFLTIQEYFSKERRRLQKKFLLAGY